MGAGPYGALAALRAAADDGRLDVLADRHGLAVVTVFGSTARQEREPVTWTSRWPYARARRVPTCWRCSTTWPR